MAGCTVEEGERKSRVQMRKRVGNHESVSANS